MGFMFFLANDSSVPKELRDRVAAFGPALSEFPETNHWPHELYVREGRRMLSDYVMTQADCQGKRVAPDSVGLGSYQMDSHHIERVVRDGKVAMEGGFEKPVRIAYPSATAVSFR